MQNWKFQQAQTHFRHTIFTLSPLKTDPTICPRPIRPRCRSRSKTNLTESKSRPGMTQRSSMYSQARTTEAGAAKNANLQGSRSNGSYKLCRKDQSAWLSERVTASPFSVNFLPRVWRDLTRRQRKRAIRTQAIWKTNGERTQPNSEYQWTRQLRYSKNRSLTEMERLVLLPSVLMSSVKYRGKL